MSWNVIFFFFFKNASWNRRHVTCSNVNSEKQNKLFKHFLGCCPIRSKFRWNQSKPKLGFCHTWVPLAISTSSCSSASSTQTHTSGCCLWSSAPPLIALCHINWSARPALYTFLIHSGFRGHIWPSGDPVISLVTQILCRTGFRLYYLFFYIDNIIIDAIGQHLVEQ